MAGCPLVGAFLLDAGEGISKRSNGSRLDGVEAIVVNDAFPEVSGVGIALLGEAWAEAGSVVNTLSLTVLESSEALRVFLASLQLVTAVLFNALLRSGKGDG